MFTYVSPTYADWKTVRTTDVLVCYYIKYDFHYVGILVNKTSQIVYRIDISLDGKDPNQADFETLILGDGVVQVTSVDDAIALATL